MINHDLLKNKIQQFIKDNLDASIEKLALKGSPFNGIQTPELLEQIQAKKKCKKKLPIWFDTLGVYFPNKLNIEQTSSEISASYKSNLIEGKTLLDLTGGFGVDSFYFSKNINSVTHCEINSLLSKIVEHNFEVFGVQNIKTVAIDGLKFLKQNGENYDWIYVDPSRRDSEKNKRFFIEDCTPNVAANLDLFFEYTSQILIKLSPMLDINAALKVLPQTKEIHVVAIKNEVKELLFILDKGFDKEPIIKAINLETKQPCFEYKTSDENKISVSYKNSLNFLYEPNAAVLKSGAFKSVASQFNLNKFAQNSHLYSSTEFKKRFPGKVYQIEQILPYHKKKLKPLLKGQKANVKAKNFPETANQLKKIFKIKDGGDMFFIFTSSKQGKWLLKCKIHNLS
jgi:16S rRNA G966 N2-methylase RsmD